MAHWNETDHALRATYTFTDFRRAFAFMTEVAFAAEAQGHHPEWTNVYNRVTFALNTHDAGGTVTAQDHQLAAAIERIYAAYGE